tara:strand:- start:63 stop:704 length:642 start_codon:yes stop_codon:yes gene_type:complete
MFYIYLKGIALGSSVYYISYVLDFTLCKDTYKKILSDNNSLNLYIEGKNKCYVNLVYISPLFYVFNNFFLIDNSRYNFQFLNFLILLLGHNVFYYFAHIMMHKISFIRFIHEFHHKFDKNLIPSIGNAVSEYEFLFAYLLPFIISCFLLNPTQITLDFVIGIIATLNMFIHTDQLHDLPYSYYFVSPKDHINHHKVQHKHYAAPLLNLDNILH